tara:strand:+ start:38913 stop:39674 length:762 start_codon:yes stop_codon:yes gene_type:complete
MEIKEKAAIIPCAGRASRMGNLEKPKALFEIFERPSLEILIKNLSDEFAHFYIPINEEDYDRGIYANVLDNNVLDRITFVRSKAGAGDGQAVLDAIDNFEGTYTSALICWGDTVIKENSKLKLLLKSFNQFEPIENILVPLRKVKDPYVTYIFSGNNLERVAFSRRGENYSEGYTDMSLFLVNPLEIQSALLSLKTTKSNQNDEVLNELNFLDLVNFFYASSTPCKTITFNHEVVLSFNTEFEAKNIEAIMSS